MPNKKASFLGIGRLGLAFADIYSSILVKDEFPEPRFKELALGWFDRFSIRARCYRHVAK